AGLGMMPWDVLHSGILRHVPLTFGTIVTLLSFVVLLIWIPLRQQPGIGTILNALLIGPSLDLTRLFLPSPSTSDGTSHSCSAASSSTGPPRRCTSVRSSDRARAMG